MASQNPSHHANHDSYVPDRDSSSSESHQSSDHMSQGSSINPTRPFGASRDSSHSISAHSTYQQPLINQHHRQSSNFDDLTPEILGLSSPHSGSIGANYSRYSSVPSRNSIVGLASLGRDNDSADDLESAYGAPRGGFGTPGNRSSIASFTQGDMVRAATTDALLWDEKNMEGERPKHPKL